MPDIVDDEAVPADKKTLETKTRSTRTAGGLKPCDRCRAQHLKCVYTSDTCQRCERSGHECIRTRKGIQFRRTSASAFDLRGNHNKRITRPALINRPIKITENAPSSLANGNGDHMVLTFDAAHAQDEDVENSDQPDPAQQIDNGGHSKSDLHDFPEVIDYTIDVPSEAINAVDDGPVSGLANHNGEFPFASPTSVHLSMATPLSASTRVPGSDRLSVTSSHATTTQRWLARTSTNHFLDELVKHPSGGKKESPDLFTETVLLHYFHEELAPWFDLCDPDCHFATVVPQRAREPGPLRNALLTISARNLARNKRYRTPGGVVQWNGRLLPQLTEEFAVPYHNECIRDLLSLSMHPGNLHDETLLAAVIALRTDEEMGLNSHEDEEDQQLFLRVAGVFIDAQVPPTISLPHSSPQVFLSALDSESATQHGAFYHMSPAARSTATDAESDLGASGLRQACFWTAFRQELHASFLKKQPVRFPLTRCAAFRQLTPAIDAVWTNRMVTFCADVLEFCYGSESSDGNVAPAYTSQERWRELRSHEQTLCALLPSTFEPTYCSEPNTAFGTIFPEIWYPEPCHVSGTTYVELARMLLGVFNPTRPQLGHGFIAATNAFVSSTKKILFRLCGIALSNSHCPPSLINACIGISIFGEYFGDAEEQDALLEVLALMTNRHAYPTRKIANALKQAWSREDIANDKVYSPTYVSHVDIG